MILGVNFVFSRLKRCAGLYVYAPHYDCFFSHRATEVHRGLSINFYCRITALRTSVALCDKNVKDHTLKHSGKTVIIKCRVIFRDKRRQKNNACVPNGFMASFLKYQK